MALAAAARRGALAEARGLPALYQQSRCAAGVSEGLRCSVSSERSAFRLNPSPRLASLGQQTWIVPWSPSRDVVQRRAEGCRLPLAPPARRRSHPSSPSAPCRQHGGGVPEYWGRDSPYHPGTDFLGTPANHLDVREAQLRDA